MDDDITLIFEPHVVPFLRCNIWHVRGRERDLVIDTGLGVASLREFAKDILSRPVTAVATHVHIDAAAKKAVAKSSARKPVRKSSSAGRSKTRRSSRGR